MSIARQDNATSPTVETAMLYIPLPLFLAGQASVLGRCQKLTLETWYWMTPHLCCECEDMDKNLLLLLGKRGLGVSSEVCH